MSSSSVASKTSSAPVSDPHGKGRLDIRFSIAVNSVPALLCGAMYMCLGNASKRSQRMQLILNALSVLVLTWNAYFLYYITTTDALAIIRARFDNARRAWNVGYRAGVRREVVEMSNGQWTYIKFGLRVWMVLGITIWFGRSRIA